VHNWSDAAIGSVARADNWFLDRHGLRGKFVVLYSGNMGRGHEFDTLLGAAAKLGARDDVVFVFIGDGAKRPEIEAFSKTHSNVRLLPYQRREDLPYSLGAGDLLAITLSDGLEGLIVPSKLYGALAAKKAVLFIGPQASDVARIVASHACGGTFRHGDVDGVAAFIARLADSRSDADAMGLRGRAAFDASYDRTRSTAKFGEIIRSVVAAPHG
jgi:glycosyltransferase involved in cell wall biosynthesis